MNYLQFLMTKYKKGSIETYAAPITDLINGMPAG
jgi:hypothetical protein